VSLLFLQAHRETDRFFAASGVQLAQHDRGFFHFLRMASSVQLKSRVTLTLVKAGAKKVHEWAVDQLPDLFHTTHTLMI
jgi:hypothetical protein